MPLRDFQCDSCGGTQERFYWATQGTPRCTCGGALTQLPLSEGVFRKTNVFPYVLTHLDGKGTPIEIQSLAHLRQLEKQHGVVVHGFSNDSLDSPRDLPRFRGER
jgi:hypothetical protein